MFIQLIPDWLNGLGNISDLVGSSGFHALADKLGDSAFRFNKLQVKIAWVPKSALDIAECGGRLYQTEFYIDVK